MREIEIDGTTFNVRGLKRKEVKKLKKDGFNIMGGLDQDQADDAMDKVFELIFDESEIEQLDDLVFSKAMEIWVTVLKETFGAKDEEKNLSGSGGGPQTKPD